MSLGRCPERELATTAIGAGSPDGCSECPETSRRIVNETKLTPATEDRNRPLRNRTAGGVGGRQG